MKREYVSDLSALCGAERIVFTEGKAKGVCGIRVYNGVLDFTVVPDRCMDIFRLFYRGTPVGFVTGNGLVSPMLAETKKYPFARSFGGGFLYTCGLDNIGAEHDGLCQHGSASYLPAENVRTETVERDGGYYLIIKGRMVFSALFGGKLVLERTITVRAGGDELEIADAVANEGYTDAGYLLMHHYNIGYPALSEKAGLVLGAAESAVISERGDLSRMTAFEQPSPARPEEVFRHTVREGGGAKARLSGGAVSLELSFDAREFPYMLEWKSMACGDYVLGLEPATTPMPVRTPRVLRSGERAFHVCRWKFSDPAE